jgi:hypothetical protein
MYQDSASCAAMVADTGSALVPSQLYSEGPELGGGFQCMMTNTTPLSSYYAVGPSIALPPATRAVTQVPGRLLQNVDDVFDGATVRADVAYDAALDADCAPQTAGDGVTRCLPATDLDITGLTYYTDAACSAAIAVISVGIEGCNQAVAGYARATATGGGTDIYPFTPSSYAGPLYTFEGSACAAVGPGGTNYAVGARIDPATLVSATTVVDP